MIIDTIFSIGEKLWGVALDLKGQKYEKIERAADYLNTISQILTDTADMLSKKQVPHGQCEALKSCADDFADVMKDFIIEDKLNDLSERLKSSWEIERAYAELDQLQFERDADQKIIELRKAAGYFRAVSAKILLES